MLASSRTAPTSPVHAIVRGGSSRPPRHPSELGATYQIDHAKPISFHRQRPPAEPSNVSIPASQSVRASAAVGKHQPQRAPRTRRRCPFSTRWSPCARWQHRPRTHSSPDGATARSFEVGADVEGTNKSSESMWIGSDPADRVAPLQQAIANRFARQART